MDQAIDPQQRFMLECAYEAIDNGMLQKMKSHLGFQLSILKRVFHYTRLLERMSEFLPPSPSLSMQYSFLGTLKPYQCLRRADALTL